MLVFRQEPSEEDAGISQSLGTSPDDHGEAPTPSSPSTSSLALSGSSSSTSLRARLGSMSEPVEATYPWQSGSPATRHRLMEARRAELLDSDSYKDSFRFDAKGRAEWKALQQVHFLPRQQQKKKKKKREKTKEEEEEEEEDRKKEKKEEKEEEEKEEEENKTARES